MKSHVFQIASLGDAGAYFSDYLALRKTYFADSLGWTLERTSSIEMDQYDNPNAVYSLCVSDGGDVLAGARMLPTTSMWLGWSYMLRDASLGRLPGIPQSILPDPPVTPHVWECTRLVVNDAAATGLTRHRALRSVVDGLARTASERGARRLISLSPGRLRLVLKSFGYECIDLGASYHCDEDNREYRTLQMGVHSTRGQLRNDAKGASRG